MQRIIINAFQTGITIELSYILNLFLFKTHWKFAINANQSSAMKWMNEIIRVIKTGFISPRVFFSFSKTSWKCQSWMQQRDRRMEFHQLKFFTNSENHFSSYRFLWHEHSRHVIVTAMSHLPFTMHIKLLYRR